MNILLRWHMSLERFVSRKKIPFEDEQFFFNKENSSFQKAATF